MRTTNFVLSFFVAAMVVVMTTPAAAQTPSYATTDLPTKDTFGDFVVGPGKIELTVNPGESKTVNLTLANRMGDDRVFDIVVEDMKGSEDPAQTVVLLGNDRGPYSLRDYFQIPERSFMLPHAKKAIVPVTVSVPADAEPGGYYGSVLFTTTSKKTEAEQGAAAIISRIGVLFFVTVPGGTGYEGKMESFKVKKPFFTEGPIPFQILYRNTGTIHLNPSGKISIKNMMGTQVESLTLDPWFALPGSLRLREVEWGRHMLLGRYTADAEIYRGYGDGIDRATVTFWVIPVVPTAIAVGVLFFLFFVIRFFATRFEFRRRN